MDTRPAPPEETQSPSVRGFLRTLIILLKSARMYGMEHTQTVAHLSEAWKYLKEALSERRRGSLQLAVSEARLIVDGVAAKGGPAEQSFAQMLSTADVASITFTPGATQESFALMVRIFAESGSKPEGLVLKLKEAFQEATNSGIVINEVRFVPAGAGHSEGKITAEILAETLGGGSGEMQGLLDDPLKLLELITAAEGAGGSGAPGTGKGASGSNRGGGEGGAGVGATGGTASQPSGGPATPPVPMEEDTTGVIRMLSRLAREGGGQRSIDPLKLRQEFSRLPQSGQVSLQQVLGQFAGTMPKKHVGTPLLLQIAEYLAVDLAIERYQRGDSRVDAVTEMLNRMNREIDSLRETLGTYEGKLKDAGFELAHPADSLEQEFWSKAPESAKLEVLLSGQAWQVPPSHVRQYVEQLVERNEAEKLDQVLVSYASCIENPSPEVRRKTAIGLKDLAAYYPRPVGQPLRIAIHLVGQQLVKETDIELQKLISTTFVLLAQEAATRRRYSAVLEVVSELGAFEQIHPDMTPGLRARIGLEHRVPDFLEEALRVPQLPVELMELLRCMPLVSAEHIAGRISRCTRRRERDRLVKLAEELGPAAAGPLRETFSSRPPAAAIISVGLLSRLDPAALEEMLRTRLREWSRAYHDAAVRQIASSGSPERGRFLAKILDVLDPQVVPLALDEIGTSGDAVPAPLLLGIASGELPKFNVPFLRVKAIEALGRLKVKEAIPLLRQIVESTDSRHAASQKELRIVAAQSLERIDREGAKTVLRGARLKQSDLEPVPFDRVAEIPGVRQRYYPRARLPHGLTARISTADGEYSVSVQELSLGGGICSCEQRIPPGTPGTIRFKPGIRSFGAKIVIRDARSENVAFEIVDMNLDDRTKLRSLLQSARK